MEKDPPERNITSTEEQLSQFEKSRNKTKALTLIATFVGGTGATAIVGGFLRFDPPNPALIIGGAIALAGGITSSIPVRRSEERERKFNEENDLKTQEPIIDAVKVKTLPENIVFVESKI